MSRVLVHRATGIPVAVGDVVKTFRGESATVEGWDEPRTPESTGRVTIRMGAAEPFPYYPSVIDAEWRDGSGPMKIYCTTYCNRGHEIKSGKPVDHECRIIPPAALKAEMEDRIPDAIAIMQAAPVRTHRGLKRKEDHNG